MCTQRKEPEKDEEGAEEGAAGSTTTSAAGRTPTKQPRLAVPKVRLHLTAIDQRQRHPLNTDLGVGAVQSFEEEKLELERAIKAKEAKLEELQRKKLLAEQKFSNEVRLRSPFVVSPRSTWPDACVPTPDRRSARRCSG